MNEGDKRNIRSFLNKMSNSSRYGNEVVFRGNDVVSYKNINLIKTQKEFKIYRSGLNGLINRIMGIHLNSVTENGYGVFKDGKLIYFINDQKAKSLYIEENGYLYTPYRFDFKFRKNYDDFEYLKYECRSKKEVDEVWRIIDQYNFS